MKLVKLPNGQWVDLKTVTAIVPLQRSKCEITKTLFPPRIVVHCGHATTVVPCDDHEQMQAMADDLAKQVNEA